MTILIRVLVAAIVLSLVAAPVEAKPTKAQSDISAKYSQRDEGIAQNFK